MSQGDGPLQPGAVRLLLEEPHRATEVAGATAHVAQPALAALGGQPPAVVGDPQRHLGRRRSRPRPPRRRPRRAGPRWTAPRAAPPAAGRPIAGGTAVSTGPLVRTSGVKPSTGTYSLTTPRRSPAATCRAGDCRSKIVERMSRIVTSRSATASSSRALMSSPVAMRRAPCRCRPVANSRWITRSWRSRAMRSRSVTSISSSRSDDGLRAVEGERGLVGERREQLGLVGGERPPARSRAPPAARRCRPGARAAAPARRCPGRPGGTTTRSACGLGLLDVLGELARPARRGCPSRRPSAASTA